MINLNSTIDPRLIDLDVDEFLEGISMGAQKAWIRAYGLELIRYELPLCWASWESDDARRPLGGKALYIRHWLQNRKKEKENEARYPQALPASPGSSQGARSNYDVIRAEGETARLRMLEADSADKPSKEAVRRMVQSVVKRFDVEGE